MNKIKLALIAGGNSTERDISLEGGQQVFNALDHRKYEIKRFDPQFDLQKLVQEANNIDAALIIMHGPYGEDGRLQGMLDLLNIPYQGSGVLGSAIAMNKLTAKRLYQQAGLNVPPYLSINRFMDLPKRHNIIDQLGLPLVIKPLQSGSSIGMDIVQDEKDVETAIKTAFEHDETVLLESYIKGIELTGGVLGNQNLEALPIVEIIPNEEHSFFNFKAKYTPGHTQEICPARIDSKLTTQAQETAKRAHQILFCQGYSRTDMIYADDQLYVLETNTIPGMTPTSLLPLAAKAAGLSFSQLLDRLIELTIEAHNIKTT